MATETQLSDLQLAIMRILWQRREASVAQVHEVLNAERGLALTTVATVLSRLAKRGLVSHRAAGRQFFYAPGISQGEVRKSMVAQLTEKLFQGDATALVSHLLTHSDIAQGDLDRVKNLIEEAEGRSAEGEN